MHHPNPPTLPAYAIEQLHHHLRANPPGSLNWIAAFHRWRAAGCRASWENYRRDPATRKLALPYLHEARASEELADLAERQASKLAKTEGGEQ